MAEDLATLQKQLDAVRRARATGASEVEYSGQRVKYKSDREMAAVIADLERRIAAFNGATASRTIVPRSKKGW